MNVVDNDFVLLLVMLFAIKHLICDFPLQNIFDNWIIKSKGSLNSGVWVPALLVHSNIHAVVTAIMLTIVFKNFDSKFLLENHIWQKIAVIAIAETVIHFIIDRIKAHPKIGGRFAPSEIYFWWALGIDQLAHMLTYVGMIYYIIN